MRAGDGSPWHVHPEEDEWFYVLDGEFTFWVGDTSSSLPAGRSRSARRACRTPSTPRPTERRALVGFAPFQFEGFLREVGEPAPERVLPPPWRPAGRRAPRIPIAQRNGFEILGPPGPPPGH